MLIVIDPRMVNMLWACAPIFCKHMTSFWCSFFDPHLSTHHLNIGVHILGVLDQRWSTLGITPWRLKVGAPMAMQCDLMVLSNCQSLQSCNQMSISRQVTQLACTIYDHLPSFLNTALLKKVEVIIKVSPGSRGLHRQHLSGTQLLHWLHKHFWKVSIVLELHLHRTVVACTLLLYWF